MARIPYLGDIGWVIPVYFWTGERVDLPCLMCELSMAYNGKVKYWAKAEKIYEFLKEPQLNVITRPELYSIVENDRAVEDPKIARQRRGHPIVSFNMVHDPAKGYPPRPLPQQAYLQRDGKLSIIRANPRSQGVYFCFDELSKGTTNMFYVVQTMTPPVSIVDDRIPEERQHIFDDYCSSPTGSVQISPAINWRFHFQPTFRDEKPGYCTEGTGCAHYQEMRRTIRPKSTGNESDYECTMDRCRNEIQPIVMQKSSFDPGLDIELRWEDWTSCDGNVPAQRREAHCYIVARDDYTLDEDAEDIANTVDEFKWAVKLSQLVRSDAIRKVGGIRLHSSAVAAILYREDFLKGCGTVQEGVRIAADDVWREYLLPPMGVTEAGGRKIDRKEDIHLTLDTPFQACLRKNSKPIPRYEKHGENREILVGTYMVETRDCV
ncbi:unnamed protein product [Nippostrongylus brasiliensis]|uniref:Ig-like domain-containing protein n=1 Tax=Nippostrongylus brasiliensis TaxID=27835 RepID=A0A158R1V0_NIPBR|nr:unnamed protein product [Nippostrongylus brasiliensis]